MKKLLLIFIILISFTLQAQHHTMSTLASQGGEVITFLIKWDDMDENSSITMSHDMEYSNDGGVTWNTIIAGSNKTLIKHGSLSGNKYQYIVKTDKDITSFKFYDGYNILGEMSVENGGTLTTGDNMFSDLSMIDDLLVSKFNTENITDMDNMFAGLYSINDLNLSSLNTEKVTTMRYMFASFGGSYINMSNFNTELVTDMQGMFIELEYVEYLDLSSFNFSNVTNVAYMFNYCYELDCITNINTTNSGMTKTNMFTDSGLTNPTGTQQLDIADTDGANYINLNDCPE